jgi:biopolymer transport protein ExbD
VRKRHYTISDEAEVNLTPMLDVVFIMLIFFIVTASFLKDSGLDVSRPDAAPSEQKANESIVVSIADDGQLWINGRQTDPRAVRPNIERLHAENPSAPVVISASGESENGLIVQVIDAARLAGVENVSLAAQVVD